MVTYEMHYFCGRVTEEGCILDALHDHYRFMEYMRLQGIKFCKSSLHASWQHQQYGHDDQLF